MTNQKPMGMPEEMKTAPVERSDPAPSAPLELLLVKATKKVG